MGELEDFAKWVRDELGDNGKGPVYDRTLRVIQKCDEITPVRSPAPPEAVSEEEPPAAELEGADVF